MQGPCRARKRAAVLAVLKFNLMAPACEQTYIAPSCSRNSGVSSCPEPQQITLALLAVLAAPGASYARMGDEAGMGNVPISGIAPGPANAGGMNNVTVDPSGIGNASKITPLPPPRITVPAIPRFK
jgi:hypothetical protein